MTKAHYRRAHVRDDALYKLTTFTFTFTCDSLAIPVRRLSWSIFIHFVAIHS